MVTEKSGSRGSFGGLKRGILKSSADVIKNVDGKVDMEVWIIILKKILVL
jgi:hypothetical protein